MSEFIIIKFLGRAARDFERHDEAGALYELMTAWRQSRSERIAMLVERLSKRITEGPGIGNIRFDPHRFGLAQLGPVGLPLFFDGLLEAAEQARPGAVSARLQVINRELPPDPRLTPVLLALARLPVARVPEVTQELCKLLVQWWEPRMVQPLRALRAELDPGSPYAQQLDVALTEVLSRGVVSLTPEAVSACEALEEALATREAAEAPGRTAREELLARVYANPEDVSARLVLADLLLAQGHARGELIMLQCSPRADRGRVEQLLTALGWSWSSVFGPLVERAATRFERGFPAAVRLKTQWAEPLPEPGPEWTTVHEVDTAGAVYTDLAQWLSHPHLRGVTTLKRVEPLLVPDLAAARLGVRQLGLLEISQAATQDLFIFLEQLPKLTRLLFRDARPEHVHLCAASPLASRLERFEARGEGWAFVATPAKDVPLRATLMESRREDALAQVVRGAVGFGTRALHVRVRDRATPEGRRLLEAAASGYARIEWE